MGFCLQLSSLSRLREHQKDASFFHFCAGETPRAVALPRVMISNHVDAVLYTTIKQHFIYNKQSRFHFDHSTERPFFLEF